MGAVDRWKSSPGYSRQEIARASEAARQAADTVLLDVLHPALKASAVAGGRSSASLLVESTSAMTATRKRGCVLLEPQAPGASVDIVVAGGVVIETNPQAAVQVLLRRFADSFIQAGTLQAPRGVGRFALRLPRAEPPWRGRVLPSASSRVCGLEGVGRA